VITEVKLESEVNFGLKTKERLKELIFERLSKFLLYGSFFYVFFLFTSVITAYFFGYSVLTHYISDLGRQAVFPFSWLHDVFCVFAGSISVPVTVSFSKKLKVRYKDSKHSLLFTKIGLVSGVFGNLGLVFVGIFSLDRAGPGHSYHGISAFFAFAGIVVSIFFFSFNIVLSHKCALKKLGAFGLVVPLALFVLNCVIAIPIIELILYYSIIAFLLVLDCYVFKK
jgi:hypothetical membrane protein